ncbi:MAG: protein-L-isoaspartate O-methyltransferase [Gammaproteobacteria bacterium]|nr:protein-L-isoaspartate O-methyltransferase [Gammaproteobacteria bacterium]
MNIQQARSNMIEQQVRPWDVLDQRVLDVLADIPREKFVNEEHHGLAYSDFQLPIGFGQTLFKPTLDGRLLQTLAINVTDSVLEIGSGSGYLTACIARLARRCDTVEIHPELAAMANGRLTALGIANVTMHQLDASEEWDADDHYDAIALGGSLESIPEFYQNKMAIGGRLFAVLGKSDQPTMEAVLLTRLSETEWTTDSLFETKIDPLVNFATAEPLFVF